MIAERDDGFLLFTSQEREPLQCLLDYLFVLFRLNAAGAVNQNAAGFQLRKDGPR
jgi:hypothetical protein